MRQEVRVLLQLTLDVSIDCTKENVKRKIECYLDDFKDKEVITQMVDIVEIQEESEIYGNE